MAEKQKTIFISADHGLAIIYFLQSDLVATLLKNGVRVVLLTDDNLLEEIQKRFGQPGLIVEGLRYKTCSEYAKNHWSGLQWWSNYLRRVGTSNRINTEAMDSYTRQVEAEIQGRQRLMIPVARTLVALLRHSPGSPPVSGPLANAL